VVDKFYNDKGEVAVVCNNGGWFLKKELRDEYGERMLFDPVLVKMVIDKCNLSFDLLVLRNKTHRIKNFSFEEHQHNNQCIESLENNSLETRKKIIEYLAKEYPLAQPDDEDRFSVQWIAEGKKFTLFTCEVTNEDIVIEYDELPWAVA
jgi:hypothetical protein